LVLAPQPYKATRGKISLLLRFLQIVYAYVRDKPDLERLNDLDYDQLVMKLCKEVLGFANLSFSPQTARQRTAIDNVHIYLGTIYTSGYDCEFSPAIILEEEPATADTAYFAAAIGVSAARQYLSIPAAVRERLGLEDIRVSLAAHKRSQDSIEPGLAPAGIELISIRQTCRDLGLNWEALAKVRANDELKRRLQDSYPYRLLAHGI
jgi:hypothetical protein